MQDRPDSHCNKKGKATEVTAKHTQKQHIHSPRRHCSLLAPACLGSPPQQSRNLFTSCIEKITLESTERDNRHVPIGVSTSGYAVGLPVGDELQPKGEPATHEGEEHLHSAACTGQQEGSNHGSCLRCKHQRSESACSFA